MVKSGEPLEWVLDALINGRKIKNLQEAKWAAPEQYGVRRSTSWSRGGAYYGGQYLRSTTGYATSRFFTALKPNRDRPRSSSGLDDLRRRAAYSWTRLEFEQLKAQQIIPLLSQVLCAEVPLKFAL